MKKSFAPLALAVLALCLAAGADVTRPVAPPADRSAVIQDLTDSSYWIPAGSLFTAPIEAQATRASIRIVAPYRVTICATAVQLTSSGNVNGGVVIKAICPGQTIYVGLSGVTTLTGYPLSDGETLTLEVSNANQVYAIASAAAQSVAVLPFSRY